ncbi:DUF2378 family protein [Myxococcaceae bacterium GXIMD 01537]
MGQGPSVVVSPAFVLDMPSDKTELAQRLELVRPNYTVRGLIFNALLGQVAEQAGRQVADQLARDLRLGRLVDFFSYPAADFLRLLYHAADALEPHTGSVQEGLRACGAATAHVFFASTVGSALAKIIGQSDPKRAFSSTPICYSTVMNYGTHDYEPLEGKRVRLIYRNNMQPAAYHEGTLAAVMQAMGWKGTVTGSTHALNHTEYLIEWE